MTLLLRMVAGSRLYGTNHKRSDFDVYEIYDHCKPFHRSVGNGLDITRWELSKWLRIANAGGHNALDLLFAPRGWPEVDVLADFRASYVANRVNCWYKFQSTMKSFEAQGTPKGDLHAVRMRDNLESLMRTGRYNPRWRNHEEHYS